MRTLQKSRQRIVECLKRNAGATVDELAAELGVVPVTVRSHLEILERDGLVRGEREHEGKPGRPHRVYRLTEEGEELFPRHYDRLANHLLDHLVSTQGPRRVFKLLETIAMEVADTHKERLAAKSFDERVRETTHLLSEQGCTAEYAPTDGGYRVSIFNCPYSKVVDQHPQLCTLETHLLKTLTQGEVTEVTSGAPRGAICAYTVRRPA
jgi:predicted ArsR family transcriptional regulator